MVDKGVCSTTREAVYGSTSRQAETVVYAYGFFRGPSCKAHGRLWPTVTLADEFSSEDIYDFDIMNMEYNPCPLYIYAKALNFKEIKELKSQKSAKVGNFHHCNSQVDKYQLT
jgi:hypothetical protein